MPTKGNREIFELPQKLYFTIGEVSSLCGVEQHVLRYWEQEFSGLRPKRRQGGRRYYSQADVLLVRKIQDLLHHHNYTIKGANQVLFGKAETVEKDSQKALLRELRKELEEIALLLKS